MKSILILALSQLVSAMPMDCQVTGISGLWPDTAGGWIGSSKMEWNTCADGSSYEAVCTHHGSGASMDHCTCTRAGQESFERACSPADLPEDLGAASWLCCGSFAQPKRHRTGTHTE